MHTSPYEYTRDPLRQRKFRHRRPTEVKCGQHICREWCYVERTCRYHRPIIVACLITLGVNLLLQHDGYLSVRQRHAVDRREFI